MLFVFSFFHHSDIQKHSSFLEHIVPNSLLSIHCFHCFDKCMLMHSNRSFKCQTLECHSKGKHIAIKRLNVAKYCENRNAMSPFTVIRHVPWNTFICSVAQCFQQFFYGYSTLFEDILNLKNKKMRTGQILCRTE